VINNPEKTDSALKSRRLRFPDDESRFAWLSMLLDAYEIIDRGVSIAIKKEEKKGMRLACKKGCDNCCHTHRDIPIYPLEIVGMYWFCVEKMDLSSRANLKKQLSTYRIGGSCPFLIHGSCSVHLLRPIACRQFNVFNKPCKNAEDPYYTRRHDVLTPLQEYTERAFLIMLPFYGITIETEKRRIIKNNLIHTQASNLKAYNWKKLSEKMDDFDARCR